MSFGEAPDPRLSVIHVVDSTGRTRDRGRTTAVQDVPTELMVAIEPLTSGVYTVSWRTVSASDGHLATGAFVFGVGVVPAGGAARADIAAPPPSGLAIAGRALLYIGMVALFGIALMGAIAFSQPPRPVLGLLPAAAAVLALGVLLVADAQRVDAGLSVPDYLRSALSHGFLARAVPACLALLAVAATLASARTAWRRAGLLVTVALAAAVMLMDVDSSHATAAGLPRLNGAFQWLHAMGVGAWIGGLVAVVAGIRGTPPEIGAPAARRFSAVAGVAVLVVGATGLIRAGVEVGSLMALTTSLFGRLVLVKVGLLSVLVVLGAVSRYRQLPRALDGLRGLRRVGSTELAIALVTLIVAGTLVDTVPPASASSRLPRPSTVTATATAHSKTATMTTAPTLCRFRIPLTCGTDRIPLGRESARGEHSHVRVVMNAWPAP